MFFNAVITREEQKIEIRHGGKTISTNVSIMRPGAIQTWSKSEPHEPDLFYYHNLYIEREGIDKDRLFDTFYQVYRKIKSRKSAKNTLAELPELVEAYFSVFDIFKFREWFLENVNIVPPYGVFDKIDEEKLREHLISREKTFLTSDYKELVVLSEILRLLLPIYGEFDQIKGIKLANDSKFYLYLQLVSGTGVFELPGYQKLMIYSEAVNGGQRRNVAKRSETGSRINKVEALVLNGVSRSDRHHWEIARLLLDNFVYKRIPVRKEDKSMAVAIHTALNTSDKDRALLRDQIRSKKTSDSEGGDEDKPTALESYKTGTELSMGNVIEMDFFCEDVEYLRRQLEDVGIVLDKTLVDICVENARQFMNDTTYIVRDCQRNLIAYPISYILDPEVVLYVNEDSFINLLGISQAYYRTRSLYVLAILHTTNFQPQLKTAMTNSKIVPLREEDVTRLMNLYPQMTSAVVVEEDGAQHPFNICSHIQFMARDLLSYRWGVAYIDKQLLDIHNKTQEHELRSRVAKELISLHLEDRYAITN